MSDSIRSFIAIELNQQIQRTIKEIQDHLRKLDCHIKWVKPENVHLTLKFLGDVHSDQIKRIVEVLKKLCQNTKSIETQLTCLGAFPKIEHPRVIWIGLKDDEKKIEQLSVLLEEKLSQEGFQKENKIFQPHVTIGRLKSARNVSLLSQHMSEYQLPVDIKQSIDSINLMKSTLTPQGSIYETLREVSLGIKC